ncbi:MAG: hypothetical protein WCH99_04780 [Verrucomicrobiota bacterium]
MFGTQESPKPQPFGVQDQMTANNQQALPVAYVAGTRKLAVKWMSPIYNLRSAPAPTRSGKK